VTYLPDWSPPPPPKQSGIAWLWVVIAVLVVVAVVRLFGSGAHPPAPLPAQNAPIAPTQPASSSPSAADTADSQFCTTYYVFSIDVSASWSSFQTAVSQDDTANALRLVTKFNSEVQAMQQADPPAELATQINGVLADLQAAQDALSTGSTTSLNPIDVTWDDISALQTATNPLCG